ncbi:hypothetical protein F5883DRAFT_579292, partial [Diaporthe sp. PMI_573]
MRHIKFLTSLQRRQSHKLIVRMLPFALVIFEVCGSLQRSRLSTVGSHRHGVEHLQDRCLAGRNLGTHSSVGVGFSRGVCTIPGSHTWTCRVAALNTASRATSLHAGSRGFTSSVFFSATVCFPLAVTLAAAEAKKKRKKERKKKKEEKKKGRVRLSLRAPSAGLPACHS